MKRYIYFAFAPTIGLIKIGCSANPTKRVSHLSTESGHYAHLLFAFRGDGYRERAVHKRFSEHAVSNEWFRPEGKLAKYLTKRGHESVVGRPINARAVGQMRRKYTMRIKKYAALDPLCACPKLTWKDREAILGGKPFTVATLRRRYS